MNNKEELKKQAIILSIILILVVIIAVILNKDKSNSIDKNIVKNNEIIENNNIQEEKDKEILENLKGLLEEPEKEDEYMQDEVDGINKEIITTRNGETVIIKE